MGINRISFHGLLDCTNPCGALDCQKIDTCEELYECLDGYQSGGQWLSDYSITCELIGVSGTIPEGALPECECAGQFNSIYTSPSPISLSAFGGCGSQQFEIRDLCNSDRFWTLRVDWFVSVTGVAVRVYQGIANFGFVQLAEYEYIGSIAALCGGGEIVVPLVYEAGLNCIFAGSVAIVKTTVAGQGAVIDVTPPPPQPPPVPTIPDTPQQTTAATPVILPPSGNYTSSISCSITSATAGSTIYWTDNGTEPTPSSRLYSGAIGIIGSATIKARSFKAGLEPSPTVTATYTIGATPSTPTYDIELRGIGFTNGSCGACVTLQSTYLLTGIARDNSESNVLLMEVPSACGNGNYLRWLIFLTAGQSIRVELRLMNVNINGAVEYLLASYAGSSASNFLANHAETIPLQATYYDPANSCTLPSTSVYLRSYVH